MRLREYAIRRYGPLHDTGKVELSGFNLIFGHNEDGKTLTIDALVKLLLGKASKEREFTAIERVEEMPEGYIVIGDRDNREYKFPEQGTLSSVVDLSAAECSNIFFIRNSDLSIANEQAFYTGVTERLTGLRTRYIGSVIDSLRSIGKITPRGMFRDVGEERLKSRIDRAGELIGTIEELEAECSAQEIDRVEERIVEITGKLRSISDRIDSLNEARLREMYEKGTETIGKLIGSQKAAASIESVNEDDLNTWRDNERDIGRLTGDREESIKVLEEHRNDLNTVAGEVKELESAWGRGEEKKRQLDEMIRPLIKRHEERLASVPRYETRQKFFKNAALLSGILFGLSLIGSLLMPGAFFFSAAGLLFILLLVSGTVYYVSVRALSDVSADFQRLNNAASRYNLDAKDLTGMLQKIEAFEAEHRKTFDRFQDRRRQMQNLQERVDTLSRETIPGIESELESRRKQIDSIRNRSGEDSIQDYRSKLLKKTEYNTEIQTQAALLRRDFGYRNDTIDGNIEYWQEKIRELVRYSDKFPDVVYDEHTLTRLKEEHRDLKNELDSLNQKRSGIAGRMNDIERLANEILQTGEEFVFCKTLNDLSGIQSMLEQFVRYHESIRDSVLAAIDIFTSIQEDEQKKVGALFGEERPVSEYFRLITGGRYTRVLYNRIEACIEAELKNGNRLPAEKLSGGAYDQLYFAVRVALGEELLKGDTGFFVLDDPFIKSDIVRLREQMKMLHQIAERGWQILFFSAKDEVLEMLQGDIDRVRVKLIDYRN
jgi:DNA repair protein SbcC/Rad50